MPIYGDSPFHMGWILAWGAHALASHPARLFDANLAWPLERSFAFSEHLLGLQLFFAPVYWWRGDPTAGYNTLFILSFALSALGAFALAWYWTRNPWAALVAGALFGFAPFRLGQINHLHVLVFFWAPLALIFVDRFLQGRRWRDLGAFALFFWLQALSSIHLGFMLAVAVALCVVWHAFAEGTRLTRSLLLQALAFVAATLAVLGPVHLPYVAVRRAWGTPWTVGALAGGAADLGAFLAAPPLINELYVAASRRLDPRVTEDGMLFPGLLLPGLAALGAWSAGSRLTPADRRRLRGAFGLIAVAALALSLGPYLIVGGVKTPIPLPYLAFHELVPGWGAVRIPARFVLLAVLAATPLAALGALRCFDAVSRWRTGPTWRRLSPPITALVLVGLTLAESGTGPMPLAETPTARVPAAYGWLARERPGPIVEVPFGLDVEMRYLYLSTVHWLPVLTPRGSFAPPSHDELRAIVSELPAPDALAYAGALGVKAIVVHADKLSPEDVARWIAQERVGRLRRLAAFEPHVIYAVPEVAATATLAARLAAPDWLPAGQTIRLGLLLEGGDGRPWVHPSPHGRSQVDVSWTSLKHGATSASAVEAALPLVVGARTSALALRLRAPSTPDRYRVTVAIPSRRLQAESRTIEIRSLEPRTSRDPTALLAAAYSGAPAPPVLAQALDTLTFTLMAVNASDAVWLARSPGNRGEVKLAWRWLDGEREVPGLSRQSRVRYDVFPGQAYVFAVSAGTPATPGMYVLELGLVCDGVRTFAAAGTPPLRLPVEVSP